MPVEIDIIKEELSVIINYLENGHPQVVELLSNDPRGQSMVEVVFPLAVVNSSTSVSWLHLAHTVLERCEI